MQKFKRLLEFLAFGAVAGIAGYLSLQSYEKMPAEDFGWAALVGAAPMLVIWLVGTIREIGEKTGRVT